jgi:hypothetical protein
LTHLDIIFCVRLTSVDNVPTLLSLCIDALKAETLAALFEQIIRDDLRDKGVDKMVHPAVPFVLQKLPLQDMMPPKAKI